MAKCIVCGDLMIDDLDVANGEHMECESRYRKDDPNEDDD